MSVIRQNLQHTSAGLNALLLGHDDSTHPSHRHRQLQARRRKEEGQGQGGRRAVLGALAFQLQRQVCKTQLLSEHHKAAEHSPSTSTSLALASSPVKHALVAGLGPVTLTPSQRTLTGAHWAQLLQQAGDSVCFPALRKPLGTGRSLSHLSLSLCVCSVWCGRLCGGCGGCAGVAVGAFGGCHATTRSCGPAHTHTHTPHTHALPPHTPPTASLPATASFR